MSAVSRIDPHASAPPPIMHPAPSRGSAWNYALEREGWTSLLVFADALAALTAVLIAIGATDTPGADWIGRRAEARERKRAAIAA